MTQDDIIRMAREAGFEVDEGLFPFEATEDKFIGTERVLERFAALVAAHEREWVDLTDDDINKCIYTTFEDYPTNAERKLVSAVIAAFKEKNK